MMPNPVKLNNSLLISYLFRRFIHVFILTIVWITQVNYITTCSTYLHLLLKDILLAS